MKKYRKFFFIVTFFIIIFCFLLQIFLLLNQMYQTDSISYTILKILFLFICFIIHVFLFLKQLKIKLKWSVLFLIIFLSFQSFSIYFHQKITIIGDRKPRNFESVHFTYQNEEYFSYYDYSNIVIKVGKNSYSFYEFLNIRTDKKLFLIRYFQFQKRSIIRKLNVVVGDSDRVSYVKTVLDTEYYYYGIQDIILNYNGRNYYFGDSDYPIGEKHDLSLRDIDDEFNAYYEGKHYNMVECFHVGSLAKGYLIPLTKTVGTLSDFCSKLPID